MPTIVFHRGYWTGTDSIESHRAGGDSVSNDNGVPKDRYLPGDLGFDPLKLFAASGGPNRNWMRLMEVQHGRAAMIAIVVFSIQEAITGIGVIDETPIFFQSPFFGS